MTRVVLDTNVLVSGLLFGGPPGELVTLWKGNRILPLCTKPMAEEFLRVLAYPRFKLSESEIHAVLYQEVMPFFEVIPFAPGKAHVPEDPEDDKFIWCAGTGRAHAVVSGDKHLLNLTNPPVAILTVQAFLPTQ